MEKKSRKRRRVAHDAPSKEEKEKLDRVAKYLRKAMKCKQVTMKGETLDIFTGSKAVDTLMESPWGGASRRSASGQAELAFPSRVSAIVFCERMLGCGYFLRGMRIEVASSKDKAAEQADAAGQSTAVQRKKTKKEASGDGSSGDKKSEKSDRSAEKKTKKKFKIGFHEREDQYFEDSLSEVYIWQYNPPSWRSTLIGLGLLLIVIGCTMYPLWPDWSRVGAYYLSIGLMTLLGVLLLAEVLRVVIFSGIWTTTRGKVHFMILPNLYEDIGFWDSFKPAYSLEYKGDDVPSDDEDEEEDDDDEEEEEGSRQDTKDSDDKAGESDTTNDNKKGNGKDNDDDGSASCNSGSADEDQ